MLQRQPQSSVTVKADIIYQPLSGQYAEKHFEAPNEDFKIQSWTWTLFTKSDGTKWTASFRGGETDKRQLELFSETPFAFVVSDGQGYFVSVEKEKLKSEYEEMYTGDFKTIYLDIKIREFIIDD